MGLEQVTHFGHGLTERVAMMQAGPIISMNCAKLER
jgi:hypothetical protein